MIIQWKRQMQGTGYDGVPEELWAEVCDIIQEAVVKIIPKKNAKRQNGCLRRPYK